MQALQKRKSPLNILAEAVFDPNAANFWLQKINPMWSVQQALGQITQKETTANGIVSLTLRCNRHFVMGQAGQHHPVFVEIKGRRYERTYSLTRIDAEHVMLTVKKVEQGLVSTWLVEQAQVGDVIEFGQPYGDMQLPQQIQPLLLLAAGSGITPMLSLLTALLEQDKAEQTPVQLWYWVKTHQDVAFKARFEQMADQHPQFQFKVFYTQDVEANQRLNARHLEDLQQLDQLTVYACGPSGFVSTAEQLFTGAAQFKGEAFSLTQLASDETGFVNITLSKSNKTVAIPKGQSILVGLEQANLNPEYGCRMGICHKCVCNKVQGATKNLVNGAQSTEPGDALKLCVNAAQSDLVIDL